MLAAGAAGEHDQYDWTPSSLNGGSLSATTLSFRYRTTGDMLFALRMDPAIGQEGNSIDGFPVVGSPIGGTPDVTWATASGGYMRRTISSTGTVGTGISGAINTGNYEIILGTGGTNGMLTLTEDNAVGAGPGGGTGVFSFV